MTNTQAYTFQLTSDGLFQVDVAGDTLDEVSRQLPDGIYTTLRTFDKDRFLRLDAHLDRLEESARVLDRSVELDREGLRRALADALERTDFPESRLRITVPLNNDNSPHTFLTVEPFEGVERKLYETGVGTATMLIARASPRAKATGFIVPSRTIKASLPHDVYEVLMVTGDGRILEGFTSNFFAFIGGRLVTAEEDVLEGITRLVVLEIAEKLFTVERRAPRLNEVAQFDEAFITSSSRGVLPVVTIDERQIGDGKPGPLTRRLGRRYDEYVAREAKPLTN